jgi:tRNA modification GTPase
MIANQTICAIATPPGRGGVGIIRISGSLSFEIASKLFKAANGKSVKDFRPRELVYGRLDTGAFSDTCLCVRFVSPNSFTGEDSVEFHCHGGTALLSGILKAVIDLGARLAQNGEFTKRAFLNGKLDLSECEGLIDIINAESEAAVKAASDLLQGKLSQKIMALQDDLKQLLSHTEVIMDYSEEGIAEITKGQIKAGLENIAEELRVLSESYGAGSCVKEGVRVALCGKPNVGKSTLFNALLGCERAIVTDIAGTTRDALEGSYIYKGVLFRVYDTAGIRESKEFIESKGIEISKKYIKSSDAAVFLAESGELSQEDKDVLKLLEDKKHIKVLNKSDRYNKDAQGFDLSISALNGSNVEKLKEMLYSMLIGEVYSGGLMLTNYRHYDAVVRARECLTQITGDIDNMYMDMIAYNLRGAWEALGEITGENSIESVIDNIFSRFCLGK